METRKQFRYLKINLLISLLMCTIVFQSSTFAGTEKTTLRTKQDQLYWYPSNKVITLQENKYNAEPAGSVCHASEGRVRLAFDHFYTSDLLTLDYTVRITMNITTWDGNISTTYSGVTLETGYMPDQPYRDISLVQYQNCYKIEATITSILVNGNSVNSLLSIPFVYLDLEIETVRDYAFDPEEIISGLDKRKIEESNVLEVFWNGFSGAESYELEWTFVDDYAFDAEGNVRYNEDLTSLDYSFKGNSTRITTTNHYYPISLLYEHGYLLFRVRGIGVSELDEDKMIPGEWTVADAGKISQVPSESRYAITRAHDENKPWTYSASFAENGLKKETASYFDGSLRNRQTVTKNNTENEAIVQENIYDYLGRPAITTLPVPGESSVLQYYPQFNLSKAEPVKPYSWENFDKDVSACSAIAQPMSNERGADKYYSSKSNFDPIKEDYQSYLPKAEGYPFAQTEYTNDNTGRVSRQGGVGNTFQLSAQGDAGHETSYYYGQPTQTELDRLFGSEVGFASHYKKNMTIDPNGQLSVVYTDLKDQTIATALAGVNPTNVVALEEMGDPSEVNVILIDSHAPGGTNLVQDEKILFNQEFLVSTPGVYSFDYTITPGDFQLNCDPDHPFCFDGIYKVEFSVKDECGVEQLEGHQKVVEEIGSLINPLSCELSGPITIPEFRTENLNIGKYTFTKKLILDTDAMETYLELYSDTTVWEANPCLPQLHDMINNALANLSTVGCDIDCSDGASGCIGTLGATYEEHKLLFPEDFLPTQADYDEARAECEAMCDNSNPNTKGFFKLLCADVSPGQQYAMYDVDEEGNYSAEAYPLSVLNETNQLPEPNNNWHHPNGVYLDENGLPAYIVVIPDGNGNYDPKVINTDGSHIFKGYILNNGSFFKDEINGSLFGTAPQNLLNLKDFVNNFSESWATSLVNFHPEYPYYEWKQILEASGSDAFDFQLLEYETFLEASQLFDDHQLENENDITDLLYLDPYFTQGSAQRAEMEAWLTDYDRENDNVNRNLKELLAAIVVCGYEYKPDEANALPTGSYCYDFGAGTTKILDKEWHFYREMYLQMKHSIQNREAHEYAKSALSGGYNGCFGVGNDGFDPVVHGFSDEFENDDSQPCYQDWYQLYINKQKRFVTDDDFISLPSSGDADPEEAGNELENLVNGTAFLTTGQCPLANDLAGLLNALANGEELSSGADLKTYPEFTRELFEALSGFNFSNSFTWVTSLPTAPEFEGKFIDHLNQFGYVKLNWFDPTQPKCAWSDIKYLFNFQFADESPLGTYHFRVTAFYNDQDEIPSQAVLYGTTDIKLNGCEASTFQACEPSEFALDMQALWNQLLEETAFLETNPVMLNVTPYVELFTPLFAAQLDQFCTAGEEDVDVRYWTGGGPIWRIVSGFDSPQCASVTEIQITSTIGFDLSNLIYFKNIRPIDGGLINNFRVTAVVDNGLGTVEEYVLDGEVNTYDYYDPTPIFVPMPMIECNQTFLYCNEPEVQVKEDLEVFLNFLTSQGTSITTDREIAQNYLFTDVLRSYVPTNTNSWHVISADNQMLWGCLAFDDTQAPATCHDQISFQTFNCNEAIDFSTITEFQNLTAIYTENSDGLTTKDFIVDAVVPQGIIKLYGNTSCFPLKNCKDCFEINPPFKRVDCSEDYEHLSSGLQLLPYPGLQVDETVFIDSPENFCEFNMGYSSDDYLAYYSDINNTFAINVLTLEDPVSHPLFIPLNEFSYNGYSHSEGAAPGTNYYGQYLTVLEYIYDNLIADDLVFGESPYFITLAEFHHGKFANCISCYSYHIMYEIPIPMPGVNAEVPTIEEFIDGNLCTKIPLDDCPKQPSNFVISPQVPYSNPCVATTQTIILFDAYAWFVQQMNEIRDNFRLDYKENCMNVEERLIMKYEDNEYHHTLYYYDRAGNLVKTVPPEGVVPITDVATLSEIFVNRNNNVSTPIKPNHYLETTYKYDSRGLLVQQNTPDAGRTTFEYDDLGRIVMSQNAKQAPGNFKSYTHYDNNGRIVETGEICFETTSTGGGVSVYPIRQVTHTYYDFGILDSGFEQKNLRNRVAAVTYDIDGNGEYDAATHYSYDIHGNVHSMMQEMTPPGSTAPLFKQIDYEYDLVSGNVNKVSYQPGERDAFYHRYSYDADNRLTEVYTSVDNEIWQRDAKYFYYKHGPLARVELAENKVQGIDYAYTLQGWLKGVNSNTLIPSRDVGADGFSNLHKYMGEDAFGYSLNYYDGDYEPITLKTTGNFLAKNSENTLRNLFNGNISAMVTTIFTQEKKQTGTWEVQPMLNHYTYDQLNRISTTKTYTNEGLIITNNWDGYQNPGINAYNTNFTYDANGNLLTLTRNGKPELESMDKLAYKYNKDGDHHLINNRLQYVVDIASVDNYDDDIKTQSANNYGYDAIGNLTSDVQGKIINIEWNVANKITFIEREKFSGMENLRFYYDGMGNRILKQTSPVDGATFETNNTWYVRDAQGNIMATYTWKNAETPQLAEQYIYGSSRLGYINRAGLPTADNPTHAIGLRQFELTNHLGNVLTTVSDRPVAFSDGVNIPVDGYTADIVSTQDYYPFGSLMPGRQSNAGGYRFGFGGYEKDDEVSGSGNSYTTTYRHYDPRIGRFKSRDPKAGQFPWWTPYQYAGNRPIDGIDLEGAEYITYLVRVYNEGSGASIVGKVDYRGVENFNYKRYSESFGPEGRGVKFIYQYVNDAGQVYKTETGWDVRQGGSFSRSAMGRHGMFYGSGAVTFAGATMFDVKKTGNSYNWGTSPIDGADAIALTHDLDQENKGTFNWLEDNRTLQGDLEAIAAWDQFVVDYDGTGKIDSYTGREASKESIRAAKSGSAFFGMLTRYKQWKITEMQNRGLDLNNSDHMKQVTIDDYKGKWYQFRRNAEQKFLKSASEDTPK